MICVVVLQNGVDVVEGETGSYSETGVACGVDGTEEVSIKVEDATDTKDEIPEAITFPSDGTEEVRIKVEDASDTKDEVPEAITFPSIKTEHEVRLRGV